MIDTLCFCFSNIKEHIFDALVLVLWCDNILFWQHHIRLLFAPSLAVFDTLCTLEHRSEANSTRRWMLLS